jgi:hypothetical protein
MDIVIFLVIFWQLAGSFAGGLRRAGVVPLHVNICNAKRVQSPMP